MSENWGDGIGSHISGITEKFENNSRKEIRSLHFKTKIPFTFHFFLKLKYNYIIYFRKHCKQTNTPNPTEFQRIFTLAE